LGAEGDLIVRRLQALAAFLAFGAPAPDAVAAACLGIDFATVHNYRFLNSEKRERFATVERKLCNYVAEGGATKERAARFAETWIFRNIYCDGAKPDANFWRETLKIGILPPSADRFCRETDEALSKVYEELPRMEIDIFCAQSAAPFPNRMMALTLSDLPSQKKLQDAASRLCQELQAGKIDVETARYRYAKESANAREGIPVEFAKGLANSIGDGLSGLVKILLGVVSLVATLVSILVGIRTLAKKQDGP